MAMASRSSNDLTTISGELATKLVELKEREQYMSLVLRTAWQLSHILVVVSY